MTLPTDYQTVPVHGKWELMDGSLASGAVTFQATQAVLVDGTFQTTIMGAPITANLVAGEISLNLPASDDPDIGGTPFVYQVTVALLGVDPYTLSLPVPVATVGTIELAAATAATL